MARMGDIPLTWSLFLTCREYLLMKYNTGVCLNPDVCYRMTSAPCGFVAALDCLSHLCFLVIPIRPHSLPTILTIPFCLLSLYQHKSRPWGCLSVLKYSIAAWSLLVSSLLDFSTSRFRAVWKILWSDDLLREQTCEKLGRILDLQLL